MESLVSIIIASYNYGEYLAETIESALNQSYKNIEIILIDDGSKDHSLDVASHYNITILAQDNMGVSASRNNAAKYAKGKYIFFLDADDILYPTSIQDLIDLFVGAGEDVGFAYGQLQYFGYKDWIFESSHFDPVKLSKENYIQTSALIRKDVFDRVGGFDRGFDLREDWELFVRIWHAGYKGVFLGRPHLKYRKHRPKNEVRSKGSLRKRLSDTKLIYLYPAFFWRKLLKHPIRYFYMKNKYGVPGIVRQYGASGSPKIIKTAL